jgi:nicotinate-nucleotide pyrophosphorylase (carboxylating)
VVCGLDLAKRVFKKLDPHARIHSHSRDGKFVKKGTRVLTVHGNTRAILTAERTALNFLSYLCGIATQTRRYVEEVRSTGARIYDTRKTIPGHRSLDKYAVKCGGGENHRMDLSAMAMIKDNHRAVYAPGLSTREAVQTLRRKTRKKIQVEVDTFAQFQEALEAGPDFILLDNMDVRQLRRCVLFLKQLNLKGKKTLLEASGGITLSNVRSIAKTGVKRVSIGALTHHLRSIDVSLEITPQ